MSRYEVNSLLYRLKKDPEFRARIEKSYNGYLAQSLWSLNKRSNIDSADQNWPNYPKQLEGK